MKQQRFVAAAVGLVFLLICTTSQVVSGQSLHQEVKAYSGSTFTYQGYLRDGESPANGAYDFEFMLYYAASKAEDDLQNDPKIITPIAKDNVQVTDGLFTVELDFGNVFDGQQLYLEIGVRPGSSSGAYTYLTPRQPLRAAPYALGLAPGASIIGTLAGTNILTLQNLGTGGAIYATTASTTYSAILGEALSGTGSGLYGKSAASGGKGVTGENVAATGSAVGVYGTSSSSNGYGISGLGAVGVFGKTTTTTGSYSGVEGYASGTSGDIYGVYGHTNSSAGRGVFGLGYSTSGINYGVYGQSNSTTGRGVFGSVTASSGINYGVRGESSSTDGRGVLGYGTSTSGTNYGVYGQSDSTTGRGVYGYASAGSGSNYGVYGQTDSTSGRGVYGYASATSGSTVAVRAETNSPGGYGAYITNTNYTEDQNAVGLYADAYGGKDLVLGLSIPGGTGTTGSIYAGTAAQDGILNLFSYNHVWVDLDNDNDTSNSNFTIWNGLDELVFRVDEAGNVYYYGSKTLLVADKVGEIREMYDLESTEVWFEDFGSARLEGGEATVILDPLYAQMVNLNVDYHVFLTPLGDCSLYLSEKTSAGFTVRAIGGASCNVDFDYRIVAKRLGYEDKRLESVSSNDIQRAPGEEFQAAAGEEVEP